jgi:hypothetical protein
MEKRRMRSICPSILMSSIIPVHFGLIVCFFLIKGPHGNSFSSLLSEVTFLTRSIVAFSTTPDSLYVVFLQFVVKFQSSEQL